MVISLDGSKLLDSALVKTFVAQFDNPAFTKQPRDLNNKDASRLIDKKLKENGYTEVQISGWTSTEFLLHLEKIYKFTIVDADSTQTFWDTNQNTLKVQNLTNSLLEICETMTPSELSDVSLQKGFIHMIWSFLSNSDPLSILYTSKVKGMTSLKEFIDKFGLHRNALEINANELKTEWI